MKTEVTFPRLYDMYEAGETERFALRKKVRKQESIPLLFQLMAGIRESDRTPAERKQMHLPDGKYVVLQALPGQEVIMSDTPMEQKTNTKVVEKAQGDVLIAGLGIGLILHPILQKPEVNSVVVLEKERDIINLVLPNLQRCADLPCAKKLSVVHADVYSKDTTDLLQGSFFDVIYFDIWNTVSSVNYPEMLKLDNLYRPFRRTKKSWMGAWCKDQCRRRFNAWGYKYAPAPASKEDAESLGFTL